MSCGLMRFFASHLFFSLCLTHFLCSLSSHENNFFISRCQCWFTVCVPRHKIYFWPISFKRSYPSEPVGCRTPNRSDGSHFCSLLLDVQFLSIFFSANETFEEECGEVAEHLFIKHQTRSLRRDSMRALSELFLSTFEEKRSRIITTLKLFLG